MPQLATITISTINATTVLSDAEIRPVVDPAAALARLSRANGSQFQVGTGKDTTADIRGQMGNGEP